MSSSSRSGSRARRRRSSNVPDPTSGPGFPAGARRPILLVPSHQHRALRPPLRRAKGCNPPSRPVPVAGRQPSRQAAWQAGRLAGGCTSPSYAIVPNKHPPKRPPQTPPFDPPSFLRFHPRRWRTYVESSSRLDVCVGASEGEPRGGEGRGRGACVSVSSFWVYVCVCGANVTVVVCLLPVGVQVKGGFCEEGALEGRASTRDEPVRETFHLPVRRDTLYAPRARGRVSSRR